MEDDERTDATFIQLTSDETGVHFSKARKVRLVVDSELEYGEDEYGGEDNGEEEHRGDESWEDGEGGGGGYGAEESDDSAYTRDGGGNRGKFPTVLVIVYNLHSFTTSLWPNVYPLQKIAT